MNANSTEQKFPYRAQMAAAREEFMHRNPAIKRAVVRLLQVELDGTYSSDEDLTTLTLAELDTLEAELREQFRGRPYDVMTEWPRDPSNQQAMLRACRVKGARDALWKLEAAVHEGFEQGWLQGRIQLSQEILGLAVTPQAELRNHSIPELWEIYAKLVSRCRGETTIHS